MCGIAGIVDLAERRSVPPERIRAMAAAIYHRGPDEEGFLERQQIQVGDRMRFDVLGRVITARVASIRRVQWEDFRAGGFMFVFRPGAFDGAPHTYISTVRGLGFRFETGES